MATLCVHCGSPLKDDARFCNVCGTLVPSHPLNPKVKTSSTSSAPQFSSSSAAGHEQRTQSLPHRPARFPAQHEPPTWMRELDNGGRTQAKTSMLPQEAGLAASSVPQMDFPLPVPQNRSNSPSHELHVKVWEHHDIAAPIPPGGASMPEVVDELDDLPTRPLVASSPEKTAQRHSPAPSTHQLRTDVDEVERLNTVTLSVQKGIKPIALPMGEAFQHRDQSWQQAPLDRPAYRTLPVNTHASGYPAQDVRQTPAPQPAVPVLKPRKSRKPLVITLVTLLMLALIGSIGAWIVLYQPFSVPGVTQPEQTFTSSQFGFSLHYPSAWKSQLDQRATTVHLYDSSHTAQADIVVSSPQGADAGQYLHQKASQLGIIGQKMGTALSFAGTSWQQLQGSVLLHGASYTETLLATVHNQHLYTIVFLAPQATYAQEDQLVFSGIRSSFQFLP